MMCDLTHRLIDPRFRSLSRLQVSGQRGHHECTFRFGPCASRSGRPAANAPMSPAPMVSTRSPSASSRSRTGWQLIQRFNKYRLQRCRVRGRPARWHGHRHPQSDLHPRRKLPATRATSASLTHHGWQSRPAGHAYGSTDAAETRARFGALASQHERQPVLPRFPSDDGRNRRPADSCRSTVRTSPRLWKRRSMPWKLLDRAASDTAWSLICSSLANGNRRQAHYVRCACPAGCKV